MIYDIRFSPVSTKQFKRIKDRKLKSRIIEALEYIGKNPFIGKPLQGELKGDYSYRTGTFRIIYHIYKEKRFIGIIRIQHRRDVYRI